MLENNYPRKNMETNIFHKVWKNPSSLFLKSDLRPCIPGFIIFAELAVDVNATYN